ncbi:hypothetical protein FRC00_008242 [Tulasnella sp. 408]|nr:hypothetical protein FRC00_008242 [Tulasnella sp. 408]
MTILFPGRKLTNDRGRTATSNTFRDKLVECVATRVDKRQIVHDYAVSRDNTVYVPPQDEDHWLNDLDWSGWIILQLYSPDFKNDRPTGSWILQSEWQLYLDGKLQAVTIEDDRPRKVKLAPPAITLQKYGLRVAEAADETPGHRRPIEPLRASTDPATLYQQTTSRNGATDINQLARSQFRSHHRRVASESMINYEEPIPSFVPEPPTLRDYNGYVGYTELAPVPREFEMMDSQPICGLAYQFQETPPTSPAKPAVLRKRSSRRISEDSSRSQSREGRRTPPRVRRKLSRSRSHRSFGAPSPMTPVPTGIPPPMGYASDPFINPYQEPLLLPPRPYHRHAKDNTCGCVIC